MKSVFKITSCHTILNELSTHGGNYGCQQNATTRMKRSHRTVEPTIRHLETSVPEIHSEVPFPFSSAIHETLLQVFAKNFQNAMQVPTILSLRARDLPFTRLDFPLSFWCLILVLFYLGIVHCFLLFLLFSTEQNLFSLF